MGVQIQSGQGSVASPITVRKNPLAGQSAFALVKDFVGSGDGPKVTELLSKVSRVAVEVLRFFKNHYLATKVQGLSAVLSRMASATILPHTLCSALVLKKSIDVVRAEGSSNGKRDELLRDTLACSTLICYTFLQFSPGHAPIKSIAVVANLATELVAVKLHAADWSAADDLEKKNKQGKAILSKEDQEHLKENQMHFYLCVAKTTVAIAVGVFALLSLVYSAAFVPPIISSSTALFGVFLAVVERYFYMSLDSHVEFRPRMS
jgi:hypothetical protein